MRLRPAIGAALCGVLLLCALPAAADAEEIALFDTALSLRTDSALSVTEAIIYDFGAEERHSIVRMIPLSHPQDASKWYKERYIDIAVSTVQMDGAEVPYEVTTPGDTIEIKLGDADRTITGRHTYVISYTVRGALVQSPGVTELYWNATGSEWPVRIDEARVTLVAPPGVLGSERACYAGALGSVEGCDAEKTESGAVFTSYALAPGEGMTIAQAMVPGAVDVEILERIDAAVLWLIVGILFLLGLPIFIYKVRTKHTLDQTIIAQYEPYEGTEPMYAGMLIDNRLDPKDITAGIVYLADQGYLKIKKINKKFLFFNMSDYEVTLVKKSTSALDTFLPKALALLFGYGAEAGATVTLSEIKKSLSQQARNRGILSTLTAALKADMKAKGFFEDSFPRLTTVFFLKVGSAALVLYGILLFIVEIALGPLVFALLLIGGVFTFTWTRRTRKGYEARNHLQGFKEFLSVTDRDRFEFHNAPEKSPEQFLKYLPYAIAFGVEKKWAAAFKDVTIPNPGWYDGGHAGVFSAAAFSSDMSAFSSSLGSSSGAGGSGSASGGGGFSGGGAGGGGGGSW